LVCVAPLLSTQH